MTNFYVISFVAIFLSIFILIHAFIYYILNLGFKFSKKIKLIISLSLGFLCLSFILGEISNRYLTQNIFYYIGSIWAGIISITFSIFFFSFIIITILKRYHKRIIIISIILILILTVISLINGFNFPKVKKLYLKYPEISDKLNGLSIVQITDLHLGGFQSKNWIKKLIRKVNSLNPDIIAITGDIMDRDLCEKDNLCHIFKNLKSRLGIYAVSGNHEFYEGYEKFLRYMKNNNIIVLKNNVIKINDEIEIGGIEDREYTKYFHEFKINNVLNSFSKKRFSIFLSHRPFYFREGVNHGVDLQLSGHTHAGQIPPFEFFVYIAYKYHYGLFKYKNSYIYTSSGTSTWGPPMRLLSSNEIVYIKILKK